MSESPCCPCECYCATWEPPRTTSPSFPASAGVGATYDLRNTLFVGQIPPLMPPAQREISNLALQLIPRNALSSPSIETYDEHHQRVIRHQQGWILLLRHASRCSCVDDSCPISPYCAAFRRIYSHVLHCSNYCCTETYCHQSKFILAHYSKCEDSVCPVCQPVRVGIHCSRQPSH